MPFLPCNQQCQSTKNTHTYTDPFHSLLDFVWDYLGETIPETTWILLKQDSEWQWHQLGHMQIHANTPPLSFLQTNALPAAQPTASKQPRINKENSFKSNL